jgi:hypothetical protein
MAVSLLLYAAAESRTIESVLPSLINSPNCWTRVEVQNLADRVVVAEIEAHRGSGALVALAEQSTTKIALHPGQRQSFRLELPEEAATSWVRVREEVPTPKLHAAVTVSGVTECAIDNQLRTTIREVAYPTRNPWFSGEVAEMGDNVIAIVNTSERPAEVEGCYSAGILYSVPKGSQPATELTRLCSSSFREQIGPFGARQIPVRNGANSYFSVAGRGEAMVMQMLRPLPGGVKIYSVDSSVTFGGDPGEKR